MDGGATQAPPPVIDGAMSIPLDGSSATLTANLLAAKGICRHFGGFQAALNKVAAGDIEAMVAVVRCGLNVRDEGAERDLEERVFASGVLRLTAPLTEFLLVCANGGRAIGTEAEAAGTPGKDGS